MVYLKEFPTYSAFVKPMSSKCVITFCPACACAIDPAIDARRRPRDRCRSMARSTRSIERDRRLSTRFERRDRSTRRGSRAIDGKPARRPSRTRRRADARRRATRARRRATRGATDDARAMDPSTTASEVRARAATTRAGDEGDARAARGTLGGGARRAGAFSTTRRRGDGWRSWFLTFGRRASGGRRTASTAVARRARARAAARRGDGGGAETDAARRSSVDARVVECSREAFLSVSRAFARRLTGFGDVVVARRRALGPIRRERCGVAPTSRNTSRR